MALTKRHARTYTSVKEDTFVTTIHQGFNYFHEIEFSGGDKNRNRSRVRRNQSTLEQSHRSLLKLLQQNKLNCTRIKTEFTNVREQQLNDYIKKSLKYQQILNINDNKKKRLPTLNSKIGEVVKKSAVEGAPKNIEYMLTTRHYPFEGWKPESREGHTTTCYKDMAVIIGGHCSAPFSLAQVFSFESSTWTKQFALSSARSYHSAVIYKGRFIIIFGGMGVYDISRKCRICYNSINLIDLQSWSCRSLKMSNEESIEGRRNHGVTLMGKYMLVLGGINTKKEYLKDFIYLDLKELRWYRKEYKIEGKELAENVESGIARHRMVNHFRPTHKNLPLYSSEYSEQQGIFIFGGCFGNGEDNVLMFMSFNTYNPTIRRFQYLGLPPSPVDPLVEKMNDNLILIVSGEVTQRRVKIYRIKERQFVAISRTNNPLFCGGVGSTLTKYEDEYFIFFGLGPNGYIPNFSSLRIDEKVVETESRKKKEKAFELQWKYTQQIDSESDCFF